MKKVTTFRGKVVTFFMITAGGGGCPQGFSGEGSGPTTITQVTPPSGIFTWQEALRRFGRNAAHRWVASGGWEKVYRGVYASLDTELDDRARIGAALMSAGDHLVVTRESAAALHGFGVLDTSTVHLAGASEETARSQHGLQIHGLVLGQGDVVDVDGMWATTPERTVVELARIVRRIDALPVVDAALRAGACTPESLAEQLRQQAGLRGIVQARDIVRLGNPLAESAMESRTRLRILDAGLPEPELQIEVGGYRLDLGWREYRVGVEYDGIDHLDRPRQRTDLERRNNLARLDWRIVWVTDVHIYRTYRQFIAELSRLVPPNR